MANKWQSQAGKLQTSRVQQVLSSIAMQHSTHRELTGIIGGEEHSSVYYSPFGGGTREDVAKAENELGERYGWQITVDNHKRIIEDGLSILEILRANIPVKDVRITAEAAAERNAKSAEARRQYEESSRKAKEETDKALISIRAEYPWAQQSGSEHARGSYNCKALLQQKFPGVVFKVKSDIFSGGSSIDVSWQDGPTTNEVKKWIDQFQYSDFDGMTDSSNSRGDSAFRRHMGQAKYVSENRTLSKEVTHAFAVAGCETYGVPVPAAGVEIWNIELTDGYRLTSFINELSSRTAIPVGGKFLRLEIKDGKQVAVFDAPAVPPPIPTELMGKTQDIGKNAIVKLNTELNGVELWFPDKPNAEIIARIKLHGWRPSRVGGWHWYKRQSPEAIRFAHEIAGTTAPATKSEDQAGGYVQAQEDAYSDSQARSIGA